MKILLTGASSFTGYWFAKALTDAGHHVVVPLRGAADSYTDGVRAERVRRLARIGEMVDKCSFGSDKFLDVATSGNFDLLCHHASRVGDYRNPDFDIVGALSENTANARTLLGRMSHKGLKAMILTGSVFEHDEGAGEEPRLAFSAYGVSKGLTAQVFRHYCHEVGVPLSKFVIPNPFGPLEEPRFCAYLMRTWKAGAVARVNTPNYVRDNIHVGLLAKVYVRYVEESIAGTARGKLNPSGYVESQGIFAKRFANEMGWRLGLECAVELARQTDFSEPLVRINTNSSTRYLSNWDEKRGWDEIAEFYST